MSADHSHNPPTITSARMLMMLALLLAYTSMYNNISLPNERSRLYLAIAQVDHGTLSIDKPLKTHGRIGDRSIYKGKHYSDKAPGTGLMGGIVYRGVRLFTEPNEWTVASLLRLMRRTIAIPFALMGFVWLRRLLARHGLSKLSIEWSSWSWILGTAAFHYGGTFFGHQIAAALLVGSLLHLHIGIHDRRTGHLFISGLLSGASVVTEYPAGIAVVALGLYALFNLGTLKGRLCWWIMGGVPMACLLGYYHYVCFGDPLSLPYEHLAAATYRKIHGAGIAGVTQPEWEGVRLWLLDWRRGLLSTSPIYALAFVGLIPLMRKDWRMGVTLLVFTFGLMLFLSGAHIWSGDWGYGPRIIVFALGLLTIPIAVAIDRWSSSRVLMFVVSVVILYGVIANQAQHFFFPEPWSKSLNPLVDIAYPMLVSGYCAPNLMTVHLGQTMGWSAVPVVCLLAMLYRWLVGLYTPNHRILFAAISIIGAGGLLYLTFLAPAADPSIQDDWIKLIQLWHGREPQYH